MAKSCAHPDLLNEIEAFRGSRGMAKSAFGKNAIRDPALVPDIEGGRELRRQTIDKIRLYMATGIPLEDRGVA